MRRHQLLTLVVVSFSVWLTSNVASSQAVADEKAEADKAVQDALRAEMRGDAARRQELLQLALRISPGCPAAHWHLGQVTQNGEWLTVEEAEQRAQNDPRLKQYRQLVAGSTSQVKDQLRLARWCQDQGLQDLARIHWYQVLMRQPKNRDAAKMLGFKEYGGRYLPEGQIEALEHYAAVQRHWEPIVAKWKKAMEKGSAEEKKTVLEQVALVDEVEAVPFLVKGLSGDPELAKALVHSLANMDGYETYGWLVQFALFHDDDGVQAAAPELWGRSFVSRCSHCGGSR